MTKVGHRRSQAAIEKQRAAVSGPKNYNFGKPRVHGKTVWLKLPNDTVVAMRSRWEAFFADKLTQDGKDWAYEPQTFVLPSGRAYTPDFLVAGTYYELKGYMTPENQAKIDQFRIAFPDKPLVVIRLADMLQLGFHPKCALTLHTLQVVQGRECTCKTCGKCFLAPRKTSEYCSRTCGGRKPQKKTKFPVTCVICGETVMVFPSAVWKTCSRKCAVILSGRTRSGDAHWQRRHTVSRSAGGQFAVNPVARPGVRSHRRRTPA